MPRTRKEARLECLAGLPRPTVSDREAADKIVAESLGGCLTALVLLGLPALCGLLYQAVVLP